MRFHNERKAFFACFHLQNGSVVIGESIISPLPQIRSRLGNDFNFIRLNARFLRLTNPTIALLRQTSPQTPPFLLIIASRKNLRRKKRTKESQNRIITLKNDPLCYQQPGAASVASVRTRLFSLFSVLRYSALPFSAFAASRFSPSFASRFFHPSYFFGSGKTGESFFKNSHSRAALQSLRLRSV